MRILQLAPLWETVPPPAYGGTEAVVSVLTEELVRRGYDVTLCASGDSTTSAELVSVYHRSLRTATDLESPQPYDWMHIALSLREGRRFDIIHNHAGELAMAMSHLVDRPMLTTMHCLITPDTRFVWDRYQGWYNTISRAQLATVPPLESPKYAGVVYNAIDVASFPFQTDKEEWLLFLSRIAPEKGPQDAIRVARKLGLKLILAGKVDRADVAFHKEVIEPLIDGEQIVYVGEADARLKRELYRRAMCLLMPIRWEEPFGLVMPEAMACGTPVIAYARGAAPEIIVHGETGYLVPEDPDAMADAVRLVDRIDPARCRAHVEERFSPNIMADRYVALYERIVDEYDRTRAYPGADIGELVAELAGHASDDEPDALAVA